MPILKEKNIFHIVLGRLLNRERKAVVYEKQNLISDQVTSKVPTRRSHFTRVTTAQPDSHQISSVVKMVLRLNDRIEGIGNQSNRKL